MIEAAIRELILVSKDLDVEIKLLFSPKDSQKLEQASDDSTIMHICEGVLFRASGFYDSLIGSYQKRHDLSLDEASDKISQGTLYAIYIDSIKQDRQINETKAEFIYRILDSLSAKYLETV